jgi:hypothetical protein
MGKDEDDLWVDAMRMMLKRTIGARGWLVRPTSKSFKTAPHELDPAATQRGPISGLWYEGQ